MGARVTPTPSTINTYICIIVDEGVENDTSARGLIKSNVGEFENISWLGDWSDPFHDATETNVRIGLYVDHHTTLPGDT